MGDASATYTPRDTTHPTNHQVKTISYLILLDIVQAMSQSHKLHFDGILSVKVILSQEHYTFLEEMFRFQTHYVKFLLESLFLIHLLF